MFCVLNPVIDRLLEAEYFLIKLPHLSGTELQFHLHAFISASRNVTFSLQYFMSDVEGFTEWYDDKQSHMKSDIEMKFFLNLRNLTTKRGPVSYVSAGLPDRTWTHRYVGSSVPESIQHEDIIICSYRHLSKLSKLIEDFIEQFPFNSDPSKALTSNGLQYLGLSIEDITELAGYPRDYLMVEGVPNNEKLRLLLNEFEPLNSKELQRIIKQSADYEINKNSKSDLIDDIAIKIANDPSATSREIFMDTIFARIVDFENQKDNESDE